MLLGFGVGVGVQNFLLPAGVVARHPSGVDLGKRSVALGGGGLVLGLVKSQRLA